MYWVDIVCVGTEVYDSSHWGLDHVQVNTWATPASPGDNWHGIQGIKDNGQWLFNVAWEKASYYGIKTPLVFHVQSSACVSPH